MSRSLFSETGVSLVVATVNQLDGAEIDDFANDLYNRWGIGTKARDEGALILLARDERRIRIEVGFGTESYIPDVEASRIIRTASEHFLSNGDYDRGISYMFLQIAQKIAAQYQVPFERISGNFPVEEVESQRESGRSNLLSFLFFLIILLFLFGTRSGRSMLPWLLLFAMSGRHSRSYSRGGWGGGFGGGGFGGFGGFGGGRSGGGGASGRF